MEKLREIALEAYDRIAARGLSDVAFDCCITKAPCGGERAGRNPVNRGKRGLKRSAVVDANASRCHDSPLFGGTLNTLLGKLGPLPRWMSVHLDRGLEAVISEKGEPAPLVATKRWVIEHTNSPWHNARKKTVWCTEARRRVVGRLVREAWARYRSYSRPRRRQYKEAPIGGSS